MKSSGALILAFVSLPLLAQFEPQREVGGGQTGSAPPAEYTATVVIYRDSGAGTLKSPPIYLDGAQIAELGNKRYVSFTISAGPHRLWSSSKHSVEINAEPAGRYFIVAQYSDQAGIKGFNMAPKLHLFQVTSEQGQRDIQSLKPLDPKHVFNVTLAP